MSGFNELLENPAAQTSFAAAIVGVYFKVRAILNKRKIAKNSEAISAFLFAIDDLVDNRLHDHHHTKKRIEHAVRDIIEVYSQNVLHATDNVAVLREIFPEMQKADLMATGTMYRKISRDVFDGPFFLFLVANIEDERPHLLSVERYQSLVSRIAPSSFELYWKKLRDALPPEFKERIDEVKKGLSDDPAKIREFIKDIFDTAVDITKCAEEKYRNEREVLHKKFAEKFVTLM